MKDIDTWRKLSNISGYTCGVIGIAHIFFRNYLGGFHSSLMIILAIILFVFLFSQLMKLIINNRNKK
jgi:hypothetical protein